MNRALAVIFTFLFLIFASFFFLWLRPVALPEPLKPVGTWFDERKSALIDGNDENKQDAASAAIAAANSDNVKPRQVDLASSRSTVAEVTVDGRGGSTVQSASGQGSGTAAAANTTTGATTTRASAVTGSAATETDAAQAVVADAAAAATSTSTTATANQATQGVQTTAATATETATATATATSSSTTLDSTPASSTDSSESTRVADDGSIPSQDSAAAAATNALAAASARTARREAALKQAERELGSATANPSVDSTQPRPTAVLGSIASAEPLSTTANSANPPTEATAAATQAAAVASQSTASEPAPVALLKPEVQARRPVTPAAVRQQQTITNYLEGRRVEFEVGRDVLSPRGIAVLDRLVPLIKANRGTWITIQGHTDDVGDYASNLELSGARAIAARNHLVARGIEQQRLKVQGMGERLPIADNNTQAGRIRNRRIDFAVSDRG